MSKLSISEAAKLKGVSVSTLRRWETEGKIVPERTENGHRRYEMATLLGIKAELSYTIGYCRVSSHDRKEDLVRQKQVVELFCAQNGWQSLEKVLPWGNPKTVLFASRLLTI